MVPSMPANRLPSLGSSARFFKNSPTIPHI
jgi:hypothetical protein